MINGERKINKPLRWGMIGGGRTGQVGYKHRTGALRDNTYHLVAGAFDIDPERGRDFGVNLGVDSERCYDDYQTLINEESKREDGVEVVSIATPNGTHYSITMDALNAGLHVICEKPLVFTTEEALKIKELAEQKNLIVGVTYGFSGNTMLLQMRSMIEQNKIGEINLVELQYTHGYAGSAKADKDNAAQKWRVDPKIAGPSFVIGDLSTHTYYISQLVMPKMKIKKLLCDRQSFVGSRYPLEDNAYILMHYENGAVGRMWTSAVDAGRMDGQRIRIVGDNGSLEWWDSAPNELIYQPQGAPIQTLVRGTDYLDGLAKEYERLGTLHQEGLSEAWGNIYLSIALAIDAKNRGDESTLEKIIYPGIEAGIDGVRWIENCVNSADSGSQWVDFK
ncbi:gfo/Idh/MocA family oxidoreductase [Staphylococcus arlettae]|uniref:Gfo/Idh/MocA family protein n=1 Tax=Staphylococcus arlettae TaxID=29378 RepID=UPI000D19838B|nr:Gfo/Idh/MocA family oxidoreductase [Staphylococcus arlettae]PTH20372.1 oxidoreductase [Staphylococcus arlettae]RIM68889.1 gfo/Idh/MocA family oxidoreductase [Staphylococcus arlettae]RIM74011.1 gfo/Idh/MocA family oxidoreductase [Staphylococcus arlettae]RIM79308.1 gfo/Idh/MocA family oxidoreductase [Staphylococcus arlettae]